MATHRSRWRYGTQGPCVYRIVLDPEGDVADMTRIATAAGSHVIACEMAKIIARLMTEDAKRREVY